MSSSLAKRLRAERHRLFVGRARELHVLQSALVAPELPFNVLHLFGTGGVGKTSLLREFAAICEQVQAPLVHLDARNTQPSSEAFLSALQLSLGLGALETSLPVLAERLAHHVVLIDTYETLVPLDEWLREVFLPQLPQNTLIVLAGRHSPASAWRTDAGWQALIRLLPLDNLSPAESRTYLSKRQVPPDQHQAVLDFTHGHPLALSLVADAFTQAQDIRFPPGVGSTPQAIAAPDVIKALLERFRQNVPSPAHRQALEACALVRLTTEALLAEMLAMPDAHALFQWLRELSFVELGPWGLFPHDLAREALVADLRWRNPDWYAELHLRSRNYYTKRLEQTRGQEQHFILFDYIFLHRDNPAIRHYFTWQENSSLLIDTLRPTDQSALLKMVTQHEGESSAQLAAYWIKRQPQGVLIFRDAEQQPAGFILVVALHQASPEERNADPAISSAWLYLQKHAPLRSGEGATLLRFWMARDSYQAVSPIQSMIFINFMQHHRATAGLGFTFFPCAQPDFWAEMFAYADLARLPEADFEVENRRYGMYGHDWRVVPPNAWQALLAQREIAASTLAKPLSYVQGTGFTAGPGSPTANFANAAAPLSNPLVVLEQPEFVQAVRHALRHLHHPHTLQSNRLLQSRLVVEQVAPLAGKPEQVAALQNLIKDAAASLQAGSREAKYYRALYYTYLHPAPTQEQAAELLGLPFSTFRRHLKSGVLRLIDILWHKEIR